MESKQITQYLSKWRGTWQYFETRQGVRYIPNQAEINEFKKYNYQLR